MQAYQYGSEEWRELYGHGRNSVESFNAYLKDGGTHALEDGSRRRLRASVAQYFLATMTVVAANLDKIIDTTVARESGRGRDLSRAEAGVAWLDLSERVRRGRFAVYLVRYVERVTEQTAQPGWHPDPSGQFEQRYWDGIAWTDHVFAGGAQTIAPLARSRAEARAFATQTAVTPGPEHTAAPAALAEPTPLSGGAQNALVLENIPLVGARKHAEKLRSEVARLS